MNDDEFVLGVHPTGRGFGWALFENAASPFDWGTVETNTTKRKKTLARFEALLDRYQPAVLALEAFDGQAVRRGKRTKRVANAMADLAKAREIGVAVFTREQIAAVFTGAAGRTRQDIAEFVAHNIHALRDRLPPKRKIWESERPNLALFNAAACALAWYATKT